jgi:hypothetical protein
MKKLLVIFSFLISFSGWAQKVLIVDSYFCEHQNQKDRIFYYNIKNFPSKSEKCLQERAYHGDQVLNTMLKSLKKDKKKISFHLFTIYQNDGTQSKNLVLDLIKLIKDEKFDLGVFATGIYLQENFPELKFPHIVAAGSIGNGVTPSMKLWPQSSTNPLMIMVGHYFPSLTGGKMAPKGHLEPGLLHQETIKYYIENPEKSQLKGSSYATAYLAGNILNLCNLNKIEDCLDKRSIPLEILSTSPSAKNYRTVRF